MQTQVTRDWEPWLKNSIGPASDTEQADAERTEKRIRSAIEADGRLAGKVRIFVKGSYACGTNVRRDSDVDIAVEWNAWAYISRSNDAKKYTWEQLGVSTGNPDPEPSVYRRWIEEALVAAFGSAKVDLSGNKAITVKRGTNTLDADVVPCFRHERYDAPGRKPHVGIRLYPPSGASIENWPEQNRVNGVQKNADTSRRYKQIIRALKRLENDMVASGRLSNEVHGFFIECLLYNLADGVFTDASYKQAMLDVLARLWHQINDGKHLDWVEVNGLKWLWRSGQTWTDEEAKDFAWEAWNYVKGN
jgi:predicted nucleotidyltransferase